MQLEADHGGRSIRADAKFAFDGMYREKIAVRMIAFRRAGSAVSGGAEIRSGLQRSCRELAALRVSGIERQLADGGRNIHDDPVPESAAGRGVRIVAGHGETLRSLRRPAPFQMR